MEKAKVIKNGNVNLETINRGKGSREKTLRKDVMAVIEGHIEEQTEKRVTDFIERNHPDGTIMWNFIIVALKAAKVPEYKWEQIKDTVQAELIEDGFKCILK